MGVVRAVGSVAVVVAAAMLSWSRLGCGVEVGGVQHYDCYWRSIVAVDVASLGVCMWFRDATNGVFVSGPRSAEAGPWWHYLDCASETLPRKSHVKTQPAS